MDDIKPKTTNLQERVLAQLTQEEMTMLDRRKLSDQSEQRILRFTNQLLK